MDSDDLDESFSSSTMNMNDDKLDEDIDSINNSMRIEMKYGDELRGMLNGYNNNMNTYKNDEFSEALISTISACLNKIGIDVDVKEAKVLKEMTLLNEEIKIVRDSLDKYSIDDYHDVAVFQREHESIKERFHSIQTKLMNISPQQNIIHDKLRKLHDIERSLIKWQTNFDGKLRKIHFHQQMIDGDIQKLLNEKQEKLNVMNENIDDGIIELKQLKEFVGSDLCNQRIKGFQKIYDWHKEMGNVEGLKENELLYHNACFILIIIFGENIPSSIRHLIASFAVNNLYIIE